MGAAVGYAFGNIFRMYGEGFKAARRGEGKETVYKREQRAELKHALNLAEQSIRQTFGYAYTRSDKRKRVDIMYKILDREIGNAKITAKKFFDGARLKDELKFLDEERKRRKDAIFNRYNVRPSGTTRLLPNTRTRPSRPGRTSTIL